ncbi:hypothetical protein [Psychroserpens sp.]|uniref:hypothetical protein n=1 Tax=Psychroserpens sp. TaxID=2020870 RepID=UPI001B1EEDB7|nr:hypothetical protein [Psychroserpens sp.]MBO6606322.1 hypothetical protein [Psychroserpens sp.]MBO6632154.1 hypothetical protein [Psychroserpens sp.]MBO6653026.1 hypothetical protein [Psychroserpens sp.]MBO6680947.1 hypothetical protein [Psychroserpens sp.]MBO6750097.1 hypothetical protein [Psychroserpens sp.]
MKTHYWIFVVLLMFTVKISSAQTTCNEIIRYVKLESKGQTYDSPDSKLISEVTFYNYIDSRNKTSVYAVVLTKNSSQKYVYLINTYARASYVKHYKKNTRKAFLDYIHPYNNQLNCGLKSID